MSQTDNGFERGAALDASVSALGRREEPRIGTRRAIEVRGLHKAYGDKEVVRGLSFSVGEGEIVAVLGPNGAGKTTTVEILEGYRDRDAGEVDVLGFDPADGNAAFRARIGIVLQACGFDPFLSVREILAMYAGYYPTPRPVDEVLELVGLADHAHSRAAALSGGQQRRLDLALALVGDPELLFLDEPTTGFDPSARRQAWELVRNLCRLGKTVLLTTHYMEEAQALADRIIVIAGGKKLADGPPDAIGGRLTDNVSIRFRLPVWGRSTDLPVPVTEHEDGVVVIETSHPTTTLYDLCNWAIANGEELDSLTVNRPSLEDVYLRLTDEEGEG